MPSEVDPRAVRVTSHPIFLKSNYAHTARLTFIEENTDHKAETDGRNSVSNEENQQNGPMYVANHAAVDAKRHTVQCRHDRHRYQHEQQVLDKPGQPMLPVTQPHQLHSFL